MILPKSNVQEGFVSKYDNDQFCFLFPKDYYTWLYLLCITAIKHYTLVL